MNHVLFDLCAFVVFVHIVVCDGKEYLVFSVGCSLRSQLHGGENTQADAEPQEYKKSVRKVRFDGLYNKRVQRFGQGRSRRFAPCLEGDSDPCQDE